MDKSVSMYVFGVACILVVYMVVTFVHGAINFFQTLPDILASFGNGYGKEALYSRKEVETSLLHFIAFTIVLVKAYKILMSYAKHQHVSIKYMVEISIIAAAVEIFFNAHAYSTEIL